MPSTYFESEPPEDARFHLKKSSTSCEIPQYGFRTAVRYVPLWIGKKVSIVLDYGLKYGLKIRLRKLIFNMLNSTKSFIKWLNNRIAFVLYKYIFEVFSKVIHSYLYSFMYTVRMNSFNLSLKIFRIYILYGLFLFQHLAGK